MAGTIAPDPAGWFTNQLIDESKMRTNLTNPINQLYNGLPRGKLTTTTFSLPDSTTKGVNTWNVAFLAGGVTSGGPGLVVPIPGDYWVAFGCQSTGADTTGITQLELQVDGASLTPPEISHVGNAGGEGPVYSTLLRLNASDRVQAVLWQTSGSTITFPNMQMSIMFVGAT